MCRTFLTERTEYTNHVDETNRNQYDDDQNYSEGELECAVS